LIAGNEFREYYLLDKNSPAEESNLWIQDLPAREVVVIKDKTVEAVMSRRWFKRWQRLFRFARSIGSQ